MCGIIAITGGEHAADTLMTGLRRLAYRGYDSAGIAVHTGKRIERLRAAGALEHLAARKPEGLSGRCGVGHTRWATHGAPNEVNAHPHLSSDGEIALVHNGIVENADALRAELDSVGVGCETDTDTEVLAQLLAHAVAAGQPLFDAMLALLPRVQGTYGLVAMQASAPDRLVAARLGSPVALGLGDGCRLVASDPAAMVGRANAVVHLDDGDVAWLTPDDIGIRSLDHGERAVEASVLDVEAADAGLDGHAHFMLKEIAEQPASLTRTLSGRLDARFGTARLGGLNIPARDLIGFRGVKLLGCGSAFLAAECGAHLIESLARLPASAEAAAEFRYRNPVIERDILYVVISQSGETYDTLAACQEIQRKGGTVVGVNNVVGSSLARAVDGGIYLHAGPEVSVASTKAWSAMVVSLALLALHLGRVHDLSPSAGSALVRGFEALPDLVAEALTARPAIASVARALSAAQSVFFIGRSDAAPLAREGALKLKEIAYVHAEAYPTSELKHGPLALVEASVPTVVVLPDDALLDKSIASLAEIRARAGRLYAVTDSDDPRIDAACEAVVRLPRAHPSLAAVVLGVGLQLLAYETALRLGRDIDRPRNLAKSVTVE
ncbi:MAG: glutamine--fructose-6-phosphate transaminase (isomerizing) [Pseudomonadota bacterium]